MVQGKAGCAKERSSQEILDEAHTSRYFIHPESTKMYHDLSNSFGLQE
jgi:hypothetical protein